MKFTIKPKKSLTVIIAPVLAVGIISTLILGSILSTKPSEAISGWDAGNIISDSVFTNKSTMNTNDIQAFLNSKVPHCDTWGEQPSEFGGGTRRQWAESRGYSPPYTCLKDYRQNSKSAAQIIYEAAREYIINPQVLLVLLQKEQSLVTDTWPLSIQYRSATGYGCPDTAACDADYYGFTNQVRWAARMFRAIMNHSPTWYTPYVLGNNYIRYSPDSSCGGSNVNIRNRATQALYNYTPYQPNQAALNAGWGTVSCGAYGNRNFYLYFTSWFGSTKTTFTSLDTPRWMEAQSSTYKKDPSSSENVGDTITAGTQLKLVDKINVSGVWYLRTEYDKNHSIYRGIRLQDLQEIPFEALETPQYMVLTKNARKANPRSQIIDTSQTFSKGTIIKFTSKIQVNGSWFYRTEYDTQKGNLKAFFASSTDTPTFASFERPRFMQIKNDVNKVNPITETESVQLISKGSQLQFASKLKIDGQWYYRTAADTTNNINLAIPSSQVIEVPFTALSGSPKWMRITSDTKKVNPATGDDVGDTIAKDTRLLISQSITLNGSVYYRTAYDSSVGLSKAFRSSEVTEETYTATPKTSMKLNASTTKITPVTNQPVGGTISSGTVLEFTSKIQIGGIWYWRTQSDTSNNLDRVIRESFLVAP